jgi:hypothetical protein
MHDNMGKKKHGLLLVMESLLGNPNEVCAGGFTPRRRNDVNSEHLHCVTNKIVTKIFPSDNEPPKKRGEEGLFSNHNFPPQSKRNQVESKKVGFSKPQFHSPKRKKGQKFPVRTKVSLKVSLAIFTEGNYTS